MKIEISRLDGYANLVCRGDFETEHATTLLETVDGLRADGVQRIATSLRFVKYVNSTALGSLIRAHKTLTENGGGMAIVRPSSVTREVIMTMGIDNVIPIFDDEESVARHFAGDSVKPAPRHALPQSEDDESVVLFSFADERTELLPGRARSGVAGIETVDVREIRFHWDGPAHGVEADKLAKMFETGSAIHVKFRDKLIRKEYFNVDATVRSFAVDGSGVATVTASWVQLAPEDRAALERHADNMDLVRRECAGGE